MTISSAIKHYSDGKQLVVVSWLLYMEFLTLEGFVEIFQPTIKTHVTRSYLKRKLKWTREKNEILMIIFFFQRRLAYISISIQIKSKLENIKILIICCPLSLEKHSFKRRYPSVFVLCVFSPVFWSFLRSLPGIASVSRLLHRQGTPGIYSNPDTYRFMKYKLFISNRSTHWKLQLNSFLLIQSIYKI